MNVTCKMTTGRVLRGDKDTQLKKKLKDTISKARALLKNN